MTRVYFSGGKAIAFIFFHAWIWLLAVVALWQGSWPHIVTVLAGLLGAIAFGIVQVVKVSPGLPLDFYSEVNGFEETHDAHDHIQTSNLHKLFNALLDKGPCQGIDPLPGYWVRSLFHQRRLNVNVFLTFHGWACRVPTSQSRPPSLCSISSVWSLCRSLRGRSPRRVEESTVFQRSR